MKKGGINIFLQIFEFLKVVTKGSILGFLLPIVTIFFALFIFFWNFIAYIIGEFVLTNDFILCCIIELVLILATIFISKATKPTEKRKIHYKISLVLGVITSLFICVFAIAMIWIAIYWAAVIRNEDVKPDQEQIKAEIERRQ